MWLCFLRRFSFFLSWSGPSPRNLSLFVPKPWRTTQLCPSILCANIFSFCVCLGLGLGAKCGYILKTQSPEVVQAAVTRAPDVQDAEPGMLKDSRPIGHGGHGRQGPRRQGLRARRLLRSRRLRRSRPPGPQTPRTESPEVAKVASARVPKAQDSEPGS